MAALIFTKRFRSAAATTALLLVSAVFAWGQQGASLPRAFEELFLERTRSVVAVEFVVELEIERAPITRVGLVLDEAGHIILQDEAIPDWLPVENVREIRVHALGTDTDGLEAEFLGPHPVSGWNYLKLTNGLPEFFTPILSYPTARPYLGEQLWGVGIRPKEFRFRPYLLTGLFSEWQKLPWEVGLTASNIAIPGAAVFNLRGEFIGWAGDPPSMPFRIEFNGQEQKVSLKSTLEGFTFLSAEEFHQYAPIEDPAELQKDRPYTGIVGTQPLSREVAKFLGLEEQGALVMSDVFENGPADKAGLKGRDIIVGLDGERLPKFSPDNVNVRDLTIRIAQRDVGETVNLTIRRGEAEMDVPLVLEPTPLQRRDAQRQYYEEAGFTIREFTAEDAVNLREYSLDFRGVIVRFVRPNSPAANVGLRPGDWIQRIDDQEVEDFAHAVKRFERALARSAKDEVVLLVKRQSETKVISVKMK
ncbi:MAG: PDZ domain-containing protein [Opitutales bacterium]